MMAAQFTLPGYTHNDTDREVVQALQGARRKWGVPDPQVTFDDVEETGYGRYSAADGNHHPETTRPANGSSGTACWPGPSPSCQHPAAPAKAC